MDIQRITFELRERLEAWLDTPDEASQGVQELRERLEVLKTTIGTKAVSEALRSLRGADQNARRAKCRLAADCLASELRPLNIVLDARAPLQRQKRKSSSAKAAAALTTQSSRQSAPETTPRPQEHHGGGS